MRLTKEEKNYLYYAIDEKIDEIEEEFGDEDEMNDFDKEQLKMLRNMHKKLHKDVFSE